MMDHPFFSSLSPSLTHTHTHTIISGLSGSSLHRLHLTHAKVMTLVDGIRSIALQDEPIAKVSQYPNISSSFLFFAHCLDSSVLFCQHFTQIIILANFSH